MDKITVTELRNNLYKIIDQVITTGCAQEIERKGHILKIILDESKKRKSKLMNLVPHNTIVGDPDELIDIKVGKWWEKKNL